MTLAPTLDRIAAKPIAENGDVVIVPARHAYKEYKLHSTYVCQAGRSFRPVDRFGFYRNKRIEAVLPKILLRRDHVPMTSAHAAELRRAGGPANAMVADAIVGHLEMKPDEVGESRQVFVLSGPQDPETIWLASPVQHHAKNAWTQNQRYTAVQSLLEAGNTAQLR